MSFWQRLGEVIDGMALPLYPPPPPSYREPEKKDRDMSNVVSLTKKPLPEIGEPNQRLIEGLEQLLNLAKTGQLQSFWGVGFLDNGLRAKCQGGYHKNAVEFYGALTWLAEEYRDVSMDLRGDD